jgi:hypothetical protein
VPVAAGLGGDARIAVLEMDVLDAVAEASQRLGEPAP